MPKMPKMKSHFVIEAKNQAEDELSVVIYDYIGKYYDDVSANDVMDQIKANDSVKTIRVSLNSGGGSVFEGVAIYNILANHPAHVIVNIDGLAASIASLIAMAADEINIAENAMMMIHNPSCLAWGTAEDMLEMAETLEKIKSTLVSTYVARTGLPAEEISQMMSDTTWLTGPEALEKGFADKVTAAKKIAACVDTSHLDSLPENVAAMFNEPQKKIEPAASSVEKVKPENHQKEQQMPKPQTPPKTPDAAGPENTVNADAISAAVEKGIANDRLRRVEIDNAIPGDAYADIRNQADAKGLTVDEAKALAFDVAVKNHAEEKAEMKTKLDDAEARLKAVGQGDDDPTAPPASDANDAKNSEKESKKEKTNDEPKDEAAAYDSFIAKLVEKDTPEAQARMKAAEKFPEAHKAYLQQMRKDAGMPTG